MSALKAPWIAVLLWLLVGLSLPVMGQPPGTPPTPPAGTQETPDYYTFVAGPEGLSLEEALEMASRSTGRAFHFADTNFRGKPKIMMSGVVKVPRDRLYEFWQGMFVTQNFAMIPMGPGKGDFVLVEPIDSSRIIKQRATYCSIADLPKVAGQLGEVIMTTINLEHVEVTQVRGAVQQILANRNFEFAQEVASANALVVVGFAPTVFALYQILQAMDVPTTGATLKFETLQLKHAVAEELQPIIADLISSTTGQQPGAAPRIQRPGAEQIRAGQTLPEPKLIADPRTNSLVVYAVESHLQEIKRLIGALDTPVTGVESNIRIYFLKNTNADEMEQTLTDLLGQQRTRSAGAGIRPGGGPGGGPTSTSSVGQDVTIVADEHTNALLITATMTKYKEIEPIIQELDKRRPQVLVQAAVAELSDNDLRNIAAELTAVEGGDDRYNFAGATGFGLSTITSGVTGTGTGGTGTGGTGTGTGGGTGGGTGTTSTSSAFAGLARVPFLTEAGGIGFSGLVAGIFERNLNVPLLVSLLETRTKVNLLSNASVLTNDNEESVISVGTAVPTSSNTVTGTGINQSGFSQYEEAKLELSISPHISNDDYIRLEIHLLVEAFTGPPDVTSGFPPPKSTREFTGNVTVPNGKTVVVGGLIQDNYTESVSKVPLLGDIPILGHLFKNETKNRQKTTLYLFVTPTIFKDFQKLEELSYEKKLEIAKLEGNIKLVDPHFRAVTLEDTKVNLDDLERSGSLDMPRFAPLTQIGAQVVPAEVDGVPLAPRKGTVPEAQIRTGGTLRIRGGEVVPTTSTPETSGSERR